MLRCSRDGDVDVEIPLNDETLEHIVKVCYICVDNDAAGSMKA